MGWTWTVLVLHVAAFVLPLMGVAAIYRRARRDFTDARAVTESAREVLAWQDAERKSLDSAPGTSAEKQPQRERIESEFEEKVCAAGLKNKTWGDLDVLLLTDGRSNLVAFANSVRIARSDAAWVVGGLALGLVANLLPTIWPVPALLS